MQQLQKSSTIMRFLLRFLVVGLTVLSSQQRRSLVTDAAFFLTQVPRVSHCSSSSQHPFVVHRHENCRSQSSVTRLFRSADDDDNDATPLRQSRFQGNSRVPTAQELDVMDQMIDKLADAKPYELPTAVQRAFRVISSPQFFLRIASRQDAATSDADRAKLSALASNLVSTLEAVVSTTEEKLDERAKAVESIVKAAAEPDNGELYFPLLPARLEAMRTVMRKLEPSTLDEGFLSTVDAWMNKSNEDGLEGMVGILQKCLQLWAGIVLDRALSATTTSAETDDQEATEAFRKLLATDSDEWDAVLSQSDIPLSRIQASVQRTMEAIVLNADAGSMAQRVQAEYLKEIVNRIESASNRQL